MSSETKTHKKVSGVKIGAIIILIISAFVFVFFGLGTEVFTGFFQSNHKIPAFGKYDGREITYEQGSDFFETAQRIADQMKQRNQEVNDQNFFRVLQQSFAQTVQSRAFKSEVEKSGYKVPEIKIKRAMVPYFTDENGKFNERAYNATSAAGKKELRQNTESLLTYSRYTDDLVGSADYVGYNQLYGVKTAPAESTFMANIQTERRSFNMVSFPLSSFPESEAASYGKENAEKFITYDISAITADSEKEAKSILNQLKNEEISFEDAVNEKSTKYYSDSNGKVTSSFRYQIADALKDEDDMAQISNLVKDQYSSVIETQRGWTIFRCDGEAVQPDWTNSDLLHKVAEYVKANESSYVENYFVDVAKNFASDAAVSGFARACRKNSLENIEIPAFALNYGSSEFIAGNPSQAELSSLPSNEAILEKLFSMKKDEISEPLVLGSNVLVFQLKSVEFAAQNMSNLHTMIESVDSQSAVQTLLSSDKVEDNFFNAYMKMMNY